MIHYENEEIIVEGKSYKPTTDVIHDVWGDLYTNIVEDSFGKKYEAYYTQDHLDQDDWTNPIRIVELLSEA